MTEDLKEQIFLALGEVSMCWSEIPRGVFDDVRAKEIGERLVQTIDDKCKSTLDNSTVDSLFDQAKLAMTVARLADHVQRLETEVFSTSLEQSGDKHNPPRERQTLLGRVNELSSMAALGQVDQSWFAD